MFSKLVFFERVGCWFMNDMCFQIFRFLFVLFDQTIQIDLSFHLDLLNDKRQSSLFNIQIIFISLNFSFFVLFIRLTHRQTYLCFYFFTYSLIGLCFYAFLFILQNLLRCFCFNLAGLSFIQLYFLPDYFLCLGIISCSGFLIFQRILKCFSKQKRVRRDNFTIAMMLLFTASTSYCQFYSYLLLLIKVKKHYKGLKIFRTIFYRIMLQRYILYILTQFHSIESLIKFFKNIYQQRLFILLKFAVIMHDQESIKLMILQQYYKFMQLSYLTGEFSKKLELYKDIKFGEYQCLTIIGSFKQIQKIQGHNQSLLALKILTIHKQKTKKVVVTENNNRNFLSRYLNRMIREKTNMSILTHLKPCFVNDELYFALTTNSFMMQTQGQSSEFKQKIYNIGSSFNFKYSLVSLNPQGQKQMMDRQDMYLKQIRVRIKQLGSNVQSIIGSIEQIDVHKQSEFKYQLISVKVAQNTMKQKGQFYGKVLISIKYLPEQIKDLKELLHVNHLYMFTSLQLTIIDQLKIVFAMKYKKSKIHQLYQTLNNRQSEESVFAKLETSKLSVLNNICIDRNFRKFTVILKKVELLKASYHCISCNQVKSYGKNCSCGQSEGKVEIFGLVLVTDQQTQAMLSLMNEPLLDFLEIHQFTGIIHQFAKESRTEKYIYRSGLDKKKKVLSDCSFIEGYQDLAFKLTFNYIKKDIYGIAKMNIYKTYQNSLQNDEKIRILQSLGSMTDIFSQQQRLNPNGFIEIHDGKAHFIPMIEVKLVSS